MKGLLNILCGSLLCIGSVNAAEDKQPIPEVYPLNYFARMPMFSNPVLSPDGKRVAMAMMDGDVRKVMVMKLMTQDEPAAEPIIPLTSGSNYFNWWRWANNDRLIASIRVNKELQKYGQEIKTNLTRLAAINRDGTEFMNFRMRSNKWGVVRQHARIVSMLKDDPNHILAELDDYKAGYHEPEVHKVNIYTGKKKRVQSNRKEVYRWIADHLGNVRAGVRYDSYSQKTNAKIYLRKEPDSSLSLMQKESLENGKAMIPYRFHPEDENIMLVSSGELRENVKNENRKLFEYDIAKKEVLGVYKDKHKAKVLKMVRKALPEFKVHYRSRDEAKNRYIFRVFSDDVAPMYYLLDLKANSFDLVGVEYPDLIQKSMAKMQKVTYEARDGLKIPAFLTLPVGRDAKNLPLILHPHGGPYAQDRWGFSNYVQFFANRGYAVLQPQFRGSTGHGEKFKKRGYQQWGLKMQDDLTDGVNWLIEQGMVDPNRICVVGSSYGGYAASMGLVKTPELYACAISVNGVHDFTEIVEGRYGYSTKVMNPEKGAKKVSPYHQAHRIKKPLLLIAETGDKVVDYEHSEKMYEKLKGLGKEVEYLEIQGGEHWRTDQPNERKKMQAMERFLAKYLNSPVHDPLLAKTE